MSKQILRAALLMCSTFELAQAHQAMERSKILHEHYNQRNLTIGISRHKAKMKCKKYCLPKKRK